MFKASKEVDELRAGGWLPDNPTPGAFMAMREGLKASKGLNRMSQEALEKAERMAMFLYTQSDKANRVVTLKLGKTLAADLMNNNKNAIAYARRLPPSYRRAVIEAKEAGDLEAVQKNVISHLMATTQFNYNRASMSEYGRSMGSMFSMFSKWPTAISGEIYDNMSVAKLNRLKGRSKLDEGHAKYLRKYLGPLIGLQIADYAMDRGTPYEWMDEALDVDKESQPRLEAAIGKKFTGYSPLSSVPAGPGQFKDMFTPPILQIATELSSGNLGSGLGILPGGVFAKFYLEELPPWLEDENVPSATKQTSRYIKEELLD
jgi:hypothetical protein